MSHPQSVRPFFLLVIALQFLVPANRVACQYQFLENGNPLYRGEDAGFLVETSTRTKIDLSGRWNYEVEDGPKGTVLVPSAYDFVGKVTFTRKIEISADQLDTYDFHLVMLGANYNCEVTINGDFVTNHVGGYTSFVIPLARNMLQVGNENVISVVTNNELDARKTIPLRSLVWGWRNYGGILRDVYLLGTPKLYFSDVVVKSELAPDFSSGRVIVHATVEGAEPLPPEEWGGRKSAPGAMVEMFDKISGFPVAKSAIVPLTKAGDSWERLRIELPVSNPKLWSPDFPELYLLKCYLVNTMSSGKDRETMTLDEFHLNYGIKHVELKGGSIVLNGKRLHLKGVVWQEDHPTWGSAMPYEELERDIVLIKNLGANAVRFGSHPPHPYMLNLCDRYGLLGLLELPVVNTPASILAQEDYVETAMVMMKEMIGRDRNHPSVLAWGIGDRFESSHRNARDFVEVMVRHAKVLDDRPVYFTSRMLPNDVCTDLVDFAAVAPSADDPKGFKVRLQDWKTSNPEKPVIVASFGTEVQQGNRNGYSDPFSYEAQARFYIQRFDIIKSLDYDGAFVWSLNDWKGDRPALTVNSGDPWMHTMGLVSSQREKRLAYEAVRSVYRSEKFVALPIGSHTASAPIIFVLAGLVVLIGAAYFYNASRRFRDNLNRSLLNSYNFFADVRDQRIVSIIHSTILGLIVSVATAIVMTSLLYHFRQSWVLDNMLSYLLVYDNIKEAVIQLIWNPLECILYLSAVFFVLLLLLAGAMIVVSPLFKNRIYPFHAYAITMWSTPPLLALVPIGMILFRVMESSVYVVPALMIIAALLLWVMFRVFKGISIIFDAVALKVYVLGVIACIAVLTIAYAYYDYTQSTSTYLSFMYNIVAGSR